MNNEKIPSLSDKHKEQYTSSEVIHRKTQENINAKNKTEKEASSEASQEQLKKPETKLEKSPKNVKKTK